MTEQEKKWEEEFCEFAKDINSEILVYEGNLAWQAFLYAKRTQPSVVLPKPDTVEISFNYGDFVTSRNVYDSDEVHASLTAAGIKYTIGE